MAGEGSAQAGTPTVAIFPDTNVFLQFDAFNAAFWPDAAGADDVAVVIAPDVLREIDRVKREGREGVRQRARDASQKLVGALSGGGLAGAAVVQQGPSAPDATYSEHGLDRSVADECIVASALWWRHGHAGCHVLLLTDDGYPQLCARRVGLETAAPAAKWRLQAPDEKEVAELKRENAKLRHLVPILSLTFDNGDTHVRCVLPAAPTGVAQWREAKLEDLGERSYAARHSRVPLGSPWLLTQGKTPRWEERLDDYCRRYSDYIERMVQWQMRPSRSVPVHLHLANEGTSYAQDVGVDLRFPVTVRVHVTDAPPDEPVEPPFPNLDASPFSEFVGFGTRSWATAPRLGPPPHMGDPEVKVLADGTQVRIPIRDVPHRREALVLHALAAEFPSREEARGFTIGYLIHAENLPKPCEGKLEVNVVRAEDGELA
jgi:hypothetical protein